MPKSYAAWTVHPHGPLVRLSEDVHLVKGSLPNMALPRTMVVVRLPEDRLLVHNAIALDPQGVRDLEALGRPSVLVVPNGWHRLDAQAFKVRWPKLQVIAPGGSRKKVEEVVPVDQTFEEVGDALGPTVRFHPLASTRGVEGALVVHGSDGATLIVNDLLFNIVKLPGVTGFIFGRLMGSAGGFKVTPMTRLTLARDRRRLAEELERFATIPDLRRIVMAHGEPITDDAAARLRQVVRRL
jgi:hypothetical protein